MKTRFLHTTTLAVLGLAGLAATASASSHREAPAISDDPAADNTDLYAWVEPGNHNRMWIVANWIPLEEPAGGPNFHKFSEDVLYEIHIARGGTSLDDAITYEIQFDKIRGVASDPANRNLGPGGGKEFFIQLAASGPQTYTVTRVEGSQRTVLARNVPVAPINIGPRSQGFANQGNDVYDDAFSAQFIRPLGNNGDHGRVFAGPRDDGFYVDLGGVFDLANLRGPGVAQDGVAGFNTHSIALEIPTSKLTSDGQHPGSAPGAATTLGVWASSSRRKFRALFNNARLKQYVEYGPWVQVSRLGLPLVNEVLIGLQDKDKYNSTHPANDVANFGAYFLNPVIVRDAEAVGIYQSLGVPQATVDALKYDRTDIINIISLISDERPISAIGDVLRVDIATDSQFPNGRPIPGPAADQEGSDVTDVLMTVILAGGQIALGDNVNYNDKPFLTEFPWLPVPHRGFDEGHGVPTP